MWSFKYMLHIHITTLLPDLQYVSSCMLWPPSSRPSQKHCYFKVPQVGPGLHTSSGWNAGDVCDGRQTVDGGQLSKALRQEGGRRRGSGWGICRECVKDPIGSAAGAVWSTRNMQTQICNTTPVLFMQELCSKINDHFAGGCGQQTGKQLTGSQWWQEEMKYWTVGSRAKQCNRSAIPKVWIIAAPSSMQGSHHKNYSLFQIKCMLFFLWNNKCKASKLNTNLR